MRASNLFIRAACFLAVASVSAASTTPVTSMTRAGNQILGVRVNGVNISQNRLQTGTLTGFAGANAGVVLAADGTSLATGAEATGYLSDFLFDTGLINPAVGATAITLTFSPVLVNRPGPDVVILEINSTAPADSFQVRINGITQQVAGTQFGSTGFSTSEADVRNTRNAGNTADATVTSVAQLQAAPLSAPSSTNISQVVYGVALDLSDFGVAEGGTVSSIQIGSSATGSNFDPVLVAGIVPPVELTSGPIISEFLTDNGEGIEDEDGSKPDWIEIYNGSDAPVDIGGWALTNNAGTPMKWLFPAGTTLQPFEYRLVFASSKNRTGAVLHTNFNLSKSSGYVALVKPDASVASGFNYGAQGEDVSYGIKGAALGTGFLATPTPGTANIGTQSPNGPAADVVFSAASGVITSAFNLTLSLPAGTPGTAVIRYTTDLSEPAETSPVYSAPITVTNSMTVRARIFRPDYLPGPIGNRHFVRMGANVTANYRGTGQPFQSSLPVLVLDSFGVNVDADTSQNAPYRATMAALYEPDQLTGRSSLGGAPTLLQRGGTHVRGQSSATFPQHQYAWELWREHVDEDEKMPLLGMPEGSDWVLHAPWNDKTLIRNALAFGLARDWAGPGAGMRTRFVEVFFNQAGTTLDFADYRGVYVLVEKIGRDEERVDVEEMTPLTADVSGGYIFSKDKLPADNPFTTTTTSAWGGQPLDMLEPKEPTGAQLSYLTTYMNGFESALAGANFKDPLTGYAAYIDPRSFQDWHLISELGRQCDAYQNSNYFHKKRGALVKALPVWDFNIAFANTNENPSNGSAQPGQAPSEGWHWIRLFDDWLAQKAPSHYPWFPRLFQDPEFVRGYWDRYWEKRRTILATDAINARIDGLAAQVTGGLTAPVTNGTGTWPNSTPSVESPAGRHFSRWQILGTNVWTTPIGWADRTTYAHEVGYMKNWLTGRLEWMDSQSMATIPSTTVPAVASSLAFPPVLTAAGGAQVTLTNPNPSNATVHYTIDGPDPREPGGAVHASAQVATAGQMTSIDLVAEGVGWKTLSPVSAPSATWKDDGFDDSAWADIVSPRELTRTTTAYFRRTFTATNVSSLQSVLFDLLADDGVVVWLNGVELRRVGMPIAPTAVGFATSATALIDKAHEGEWRSWLSAPGVLREGGNTLAVEVHQYNQGNGVANANDLSFELRVRGLSLVPGTPVPFASGGVHVVRARSRTGSAWSPLAEASFTVGTTAAAAVNLAVTELMYHPADGVAAEAPYTSEDDFEFIEIANISTGVVDLTGVTLADAVVFSFNDAPAPARVLAPGGRVVVVSNAAAFALRYPGSTAVVAGQYTGNFKDSSEQVSLLDAGGGVIRRFTYTDAEPWPVDADGAGPSLVLNAAADIDHTMPSNWHAGAAPNGTPGLDDHLPMPADPAGDADSNGLTNFYEFATGGSILPTMVLEDHTPPASIRAKYAVFRFRRNLAAGGLVFEPQGCADLGVWKPEDMIYLGTARQPDGTAIVTCRSALPAADLPGKFFARLKIR